MDVPVKPSRYFFVRLLLFFLLQSQFQSSCKAIAISLGFHGKTTPTVPAASDTFPPHERSE
ncbi:hypothetical protein SAMN05443245_5714 [Paraburkholderia fungorum]|uniref:Uncharacterized protein n=1 Tax=Paraburkholderia fungorum TaxID=134537 RepID=A0A1H1IUZ4_9BURK|nr:hypothetical protein SAMN05443245_5714 [Paraburkholderia fungorum]